MMDKKLFADLVESMQQHNEIIAGTRKPARVTKVDAQSIKVLRAKAGLTQEKYAALIQVDGNEPQLPKNSHHRSYYSP